MRTLKVMLLGGALALPGFVGTAVAGEKIPQTAAEHEQAASEYLTKAKGHRAEADMHRNMAEMYQAQIKGPSNRKPNPWLINMVKHCKQIGVKNDALAAEEEKAAELLSKQAKASQETAHNKQ
jgi:hypothetical protein